MAALPAACSGAHGCGDARWGWRGPRGGQRTAGGGGCLGGHGWPAEVENWSRRWRRAGGGAEAAGASHPRRVGHTGARSHTRVFPCWRACVPCVCTRRLTVGLGQPPLPTRTEATPATPASARAARKNKAKQAKSGKATKASKGKVRAPVHRSDWHELSEEPWKRGAGGRDEPLVSWKVR